MKSSIVEAWRRMAIWGRALMVGQWLATVGLFTACGGRTALEVDLSAPPASSAAGAGGSGGAPCTTDWDQLRWDDSRDEAVVYLWTSSATDTWAVVTGDGNADTGFIRDHWDGSRWTHTVSERDPSGHFGKQQIWAAEGGQAFAGSSKNLQRWSGDRWTDWVDSPGCHAIAGTTTDDLWCATESELWHFDGSSWTRQVMSGILGILARARNDVWVWGTLGASHYDGVRWSLELTNLVRLVSASEANAVWALQDGLVLHWSGQPGSPWTHQNPTGAQNSGLWSQSRTNTWIVGAGAAMRWNGSSWLLVDLPLQDERLLLSGSSEDVWIAGTAFLAHGHPACR